MESGCTAQVGCPLQIDRFFCIGCLRQDDSFKGWPFNTNCDVLSYLFHQILNLHIMLKIQNLYICLPNAYISKCLTNLNVYSQSCIKRPLFWKAWVARKQGCSLLFEVSQAENSFRSFLHDFLPVLSCHLYFRIHYINV